MVAAGSAPSSSSASASAAQAQAQARREAEARAAEARRRAAEQARREAEARAAEEARRRAEEARQRSAQAQRTAAERTAAARAPRQAATEARDRVTAERRLFAHESRTMAPEARASWQRRIDADDREARALSTRADEAERRARTARAEALTAGDAALTAERTANARARAAGQPVPYRGADEVVDTLDAGSLARAEQARLLGAPAAVSPDEAARADAARVADATDRGPVQGAEALERALRESDDVDYRRALVEHSAPSVERIGRALADDTGVCLTSETQDRAAAALAGAAEHAGPDGGRRLAEAFVRGWPEQREAPDVAAALGHAAGTPAGARLGADVADALAARGDYASADAVTSASPAIAAHDPVDAGERAASDAVAVDGEASLDQRTALEGDLDRTDRATRQRVDEVFARAADPALPRNTTATVDGDRAEIITRDRQGNVTSRELAVRDGDDVTYERVDYRGGNATRQTYAVDDDAVTVTTADWRERPSAAPTTPSWDALAARAEHGEGGIALREVSYRDTGDALEAHERAVDGTGRSEVTQTFRTQTGGDGIHGTPEEAFDTDRDIHVVETERVTQAWGEDEARTREWSYEQDHVRATAMDAEGDDVPKQWRLEKQDGNVYRAQTFVEGSEDFTTLTERRAEGDTVTETQTSRGVDEDGDDYEVESTSRTRFARDGRIAAQHVDRHDPDGTHTVLDYARTEDPSGRIREETRSVVTDPEGHTSEALRTQESVRENGVERIVGLTTTVRGEGGTATSTLTERGGQQLTVNGQPVPISEGSAQLDALSDAERDLAAQATADNLTTVKKAAEQGKNVLELAKFAGVGASNTYSRGTNTADVLNRRLELQKIRLEARFGDRFTAAEEGLLRGASGAKGAVGALGALASGASFLADIQRHDWIKAGIDAGGVAVGGANVVAATRELSALRATPNGALALDDLGGVAGKFGTFAKFGGLAVGVAAGGYQVVDGIVRGDGVSIAQGGVGIAGTVAAFAAGGAIGGPAGVLAGVGIGLGTVAIQWGIGKLFGDDEPKTAALEI